MQRRIYLPLLVVLACGALLRIVLLFGYTPADLSYPDTWGYVRAANGPLFMADWIRPAGYPAFLAVAHAVWGTITLPIMLQHLIGLATAGVLYCAVRRLGLARWIAVLPAAVMALTPDAMYFEHSLLSESLYMLLLAGMLYSLIRGLEGALGWLALGGVLLAAATTVRTSGLFYVPVALFAVLAFRPAIWRRRLAAAAVLAAAIALPLIGYAALQNSQNGHFGLTQGGGWALYARAAPFADCRAFTPPPGTEALCETSDARTRPGPDFYAWNPASPAQRLFGGPPHNDGTVGEFGRAAITGQPRAFISAVATDLWRIVDSDAGRDRIANGGGPEVVSLTYRDASVEQINRTVVEPYYGSYTIRVHGAAEALAELQTVLRVHGPLVLLAALLALVALPFARGANLRGLVLFGLGGLVPLVITITSTVYNWRYAVPQLPLLVAGGAIGATVIAARVRAPAASRRLAEPASPPREA